jgi:hypothetical protein
MLLNRTPRAQGQARLAAKMRDAGIEPATPCV